MKRGRSQAFGVSYVCSEDTRGFSKDPQVLKNCRLPAELALCRAPTCRFGLWPLFGGAQPCRPGWQCLEQEANACRCSSPGGSSPHQDSPYTGFRLRHGCLGVFTGEGLMEPCWMANWIPPSRKAVRCEALGSRCFLSVLFGSLSLSGSGEKSYCHISEGGYCGHLNSCFLGCAAGVVPYYEMIFEGCGAFANLSVLHGKGEKFCWG